MSAGAIVAVAFALCVLLVIIMLVRLTRRPVTAEDHAYAAIDEDLDARRERAAVAALYGGPRLIDVSPLDCPVDALAPVDPPGLP